MKTALLLLPLLCSLACAQIAPNVMNAYRAAAKPPAAASTVEALPTVTTGTLLWNLNANEVTGLASNDQMTVWSDIGGGAEHFYQGGSAAQPLWRSGIQNGRAGVYFATDYMTNLIAVATNKLTVFLVCRADSFGTTYNGFASVNNIASSTDWNQPNAAQLYNFQAGPYIGQAFVNSTARSKKSGLVLTTNYIFASAFDGVNHIFYHNGNTNTAFATTNTFTTDSAWLGQGKDISVPYGQFTGYVFHYIAYTGNLSDADRKTIEAELSTKWNIAVIP